MMTWQRRVLALAVLATYVVLRPEHFTAVSARVRKHTTTTAPKATTTTTSTPSSTTTAKPATTTTTQPASTACPVFPADNAWNIDISSYPVHPNSANYVASIGASTNLQTDFGTSWNGAPIGIPFVHVGAGQPLVPITFDYADRVVIVTCSSSTTRTAPL